MSAKAVDGRKDSLSIFGSDCVRSLYNYTTEWRVDLGAVISIHHIFIQYATDNLPWGIVSNIKKKCFKIVQYILLFRCASLNVNMIDRPHVLCTS